MKCTPIRDPRNNIYRVKKYYRVKKDIFRIVVFVNRKKYNLKKELKYNENYPKKKKSF